MTWSTAHKIAAGLCWRAAKGNTATAVAQFSNYISSAGLELPANVVEFVETWGPRLGDDGEVAAHASLSGRKRKLTVEQVVACHYEAVNWFLSGRYQPYCSIQELVENNEKVQLVVQQSGVSLRTLRRRLTEMYPAFHFGHLRARPYLTEQHRANRMQAAELHLQATEQKLSAVVWGDEKILRMSVEHGVGWFDIGGDDYFHPPPSPKHKGKTVTLKYFIAVNAVLGPVYLKFFTGTSGLEADREGHAYRVSSAYD